jgi:molybdopterin-guanine dinucleotide biosynthesis protein A
MTTAVILSGGKGLRINGREKGMLPIEGKSFIEHKVDILSPLFDEILLVVNRPELYSAVNPRGRIVQDAEPYSGVLGALLTGLDNAAGDLAFVTTSDTPFLLPGVAEYLLELAAASSGNRTPGPGRDGAVAVWEDKIEPLCAVYSTRCADYIRQVLPKKRIRAFYHLADIVFADESEIRKIDPEGRSFININTAEDYARRFTPEGEPRI